MFHTSNVGDQEFLTQKVILCTDLKEKIMLQIYDGPFVLENWALHLLNLRNFSLRYIVVSPNLPTMKSSPHTIRHRQHKLNSNKYTTMLHFHICKYFLKTQCCERLYKNRYSDILLLLSRFSRV